MPKRRERIHRNKRKRTWLQYFAEAMALADWNGDGAGEQILALDEFWEKDERKRDEGSGHSA